MGQENIDTVQDSNIQALRDLTSDLRAGTIPTGWTNADNAATASIAFFTGDIESTTDREAIARNIDSASWVLSIGRLNSDYVFARIPHGANPALYSALDVPTRTNLRPARLLLSSWIASGNSGGDNPTYDYYLSNGLIGNNLSITLQVTGSAAHIGTSTFGGEVIGTLADNIVTSDAILNGAVLEDKIGNNAVSEEKLAAAVRTKLNAARGGSSAFYTPLEATEYVDSGTSTDIDAQADLGKFYIHDTGSDYEFAIDSTDFTESALVGFFNSSGGVLTLSGEVEFTLALDQYAVFLYEAEEVSLFIMWNTNVPGGLTQAQADARYLREATADTRYLRETGGTGDLGDAGEIRQRIEGQRVAFNQDYTLATDDYGKVLQFFGTTARTLTLPNPAAEDAGHRVWINNNSTAALTITPHSSDAINNGTAGNSVTLDAGHFAILFLANPAAAGNWTFRDLTEEADLSETVKYYASVPVATGRPDGEIIFVEGEQYELTTHTDGRIEGEPGGRSLDINGERADMFGWVTPATTHAALNVTGPFGKVIGEFSHNPVNTGGDGNGIDVAAIYGLHVGLSTTAPTRFQAFALVDKDSYEVAKGSSIARNDPLTIQLSATGQTSQAVVAFHNGAELNLNGVEYAEFQVEVTGATLAAVTGGSTQQQSVYNWFDFLDTAAEDGNDVTIGLFAAGTAGNPSLLPARRFAGQERGFSPVYDDLEKRNQDRIEDLEIGGTSNAVITTKINTLFDLTADQRVETVGVTWARSTNAQSAGGVYFSATELNLGGIRGVAASNYRTSLLFENQSGYVYVRVPHGLDPNSGRLVFLHTDGSVTRNRLASMWNMGNNAAVTFTFYGFYQQAIVDSNVQQVELQLSSNVQDVVYHGAFAISTFPDVTGAFVRLTQAQYDALSDNDKANGKIYSIIASS